MVPVVKNAKDNLIDILSTSEKHTVLYVYWHRQEGGVIHDTGISAYREFFPSVPKLSRIDIFGIELLCAPNMQRFLKTNDSGMYLFPEEVVNVSGSFLLNRLIRLL